MAERKTINKKTRFEVFKRDNFTCQYCGRMAPDVVLEIDHINPVNNGGTNDIMNLITSCFDCNRGKGKRKLTQNEEIKKQQEQLLSVTGSSFSEYGRNNCKKEIKKYGFDEVYECTKISLEQYYEIGNHESVTKTFNYIGKICANREYQRKNPKIAKVNYLVKVAKNRLHYLREYDLKKYLVNNFEEEDFDYIKEIFISARNWTELMNELNDYYFGGE